MLYIIRGIPGGGKTTLAKSLLKTGAIERFFEYGVFTCHCLKNGFNKTSFSQFQENTREAVFSELEQGKHVAVVHSFAKLFLMKPFIDFVKKKDIPYAIISCVGQSGWKSSTVSERVQVLSMRIWEFE